MAKTGLHDVREMIGSASMLRTGMLASLIFGFISVAVSAEEAQQLMCTGMMIGKVLDLLGIWRGASFA